MEIKKTAKGWKYDGVIYRDERSARGVKQASEKDHSLPESLTKSAKFNLLYDSEHPTSFGTFVAEYLRVNGKSIIGLAREIGVSKQALFNWMNASSLPTSKHAVNIMQVMQCSSVELVKALEDNFQYPKLKMLEELKEA